MERRNGKDVRRVTLVNTCGPADNIGDWALTVAAAQIVSNVWPGADIDMIPWSRQSDPAAIERALLSELGLAPSTMKVAVLKPANRADAQSQPAGGTNGPIRVGRRLQDFARTELGLLLQRLKGPSHLSGLNRFGANSLSTSDRVVFVGGNIVCGPRDLRRVAHLHRALTSVRRAELQGIPCYLLGCTYDVSDNLLTRSLALNPLRNAACVVAREEITYRKLVAAGLTNVQRGGDPGFCLSHPQSSERDANAIAVNMFSEIEWNSAVGTSAAEHTQALKRETGLLRSVLRRFPAVKLRLVPHESPRSSGPSDLVELRCIADALGEPDRVTVMDPCRRLADVWHHYGSCSVVLGPRYHGYVFGALMGTPVVGIGPSVQKNAGITSLLGLPWFPDDASSDDAALDQVGRLLIWDVDMREGLVQMASGIGRGMLELFSGLALPISNGNRVSKQPPCEVLAGNEVE